MCPTKPEYSTLFHISTATNTNAMRVVPHYIPPSMLLPWMNKVSPAMAVLMVFLSTFSKATLAIWVGHSIPSGGGTVNKRNDRGRTVSQWDGGRTVHK